jgi:hypothetical protein
MASCCEAHHIVNTPVPEKNYLVSLVRGETEALREIMPKFEQSLQKLEATFPNVIKRNGISGKHC